MLGDDRQATINAMEKPAPKTDTPVSTLLVLKAVQPVVLHSPPAAFYKQLFLNETTGIREFRLDHIFVKTLPANDEISCDA